MKIAYFGNDIFYDCLNLLLGEGHEIIRAYIPPKPSEGYDFSQNMRGRTAAKGIEVFNNKPNADDIAELKELGCEMVLAAGYPYKIPEWQGGSVRYGVNIHPSLLPEGGGSTPMPLVITKGLSKTGTTLHKLSQDWDAGDIILQEAFDLNGKEILNDILKGCQDLAVKLLAEFLQNPDKCWNESYPQNPKEGDYWPKEPAEDLRVHFSKGVNIVEKYLRAHRFVNEEGVIEYMTDISFWREHHNHEHGSVLSQHNNSYLMAAADGLVSFNMKTEPSPKYDFSSS